MLTHIALAKSLLKIHEGFEAHPYKCTAGIWTIGYGRNLETRGITEDEALYMLENDIKIAEDWLASRYPYYRALNSQRKAVLIDMLVNLGAGRFAQFLKMHHALHDHNYELAALEMLDSRWAQQVGNRAIELSKIMHSGSMP